MVTKCRARERWGVEGSITEYRALSVLHFSSLTHWDENFLLLTGWPSSWLLYDLRVRVHNQDRTCLPPSCPPLWAGKCAVRGQDVPTPPTPTAAASTIEGYRVEPSLQLLALHSPTSKQAAGQDSGSLDSSCAGIRLFIFAINFLHIAKTSGNLGVSARLQPGWVYRNGSIHTC